MKTRTLLAAATFLLAAVALTPGAAAQDLCSNPAISDDVCCRAPSNPTTQYTCTVIGATGDYVGGYVDAARALADCLVYERPIGQWLTHCIVLF